MAFILTLKMTPNWQIKKSISFLQPNFSSISFLLWVETKTKRKIKKEKFFLLSRTTYLHSRPVQVDHSHNDLMLSLFIALRALPSSTVATTSTLSKFFHNCYVSHDRSFPSFAEFFLLQQVTFFSPVQIGKITTPSGMQLFERHWLRVICRSFQ